ncbi:hypothetical protein VF21_00015 [Pseudogymnoascus sp. 05NY08]|nr:hypothetical protein VF21_00280 [Pseudogymnoascus sp. 05NY08]OBT80929.1 hypothetical protein VF21_00015 [Pseudogymnoascus sp. 05NY08]
MERRKLNSGSKPSQFDQSHLINPTSASRLIVNPAKMPTIHTLDARDVAMQLSKRENWAKKEAGVVVVFCIVGVVALGVTWLCIHKWMLRRRANRPQK